MLTTANADEQQAPTNKGLPTITLPPITLPPITIHDVITIRPPAVTLPPVTIPGPTTTVQGPRETITIHDTKTVTVTNRATEKSTATERATERRTDRSVVTETAKPDQDDPLPPDSGGNGVDFGDDDITVVEIGVVSLSAIVALGLGLLLLYIGYVIGYKDKERKDTNFMRSLLDASRLRRRS